MADLPPYLDAEDLAATVRRALAEDVGAGDVTTAASVPLGTHAEAVLVAKEEGVLAGIGVVEETFRQLDRGLEIGWNRSDGDALRPGDHVATLRGDAHAILTGERTALNFMQRMSGIATTTRRMVDAVKPHSAQILDTRKTAPGLRRLDKWAVLIGGGRNHRVGLFDMILIKENHVAAAGGIPQAIRAAAAWCDANRRIPIEIETRSVDEVREVLDVGGVEIILLDNMVRPSRQGIDTSLLSRCVDLIDRRCKTEASGNVTLETVNAVAATGVDFISSGALTHSVRALDLSLLVELRND